MMRYPTLPVLLLTAALAPAFAQHDDRDHDRDRDRGHEQHERQERQERYGSRDREMRNDRDDHYDRRWQDERRWEQNSNWRGGNSWYGNRARNWNNDHRTWSQRGGYGGYVIPQYQFRNTFGPNHYFRLRSRPVMYMGYPRFNYGGYSFLVVDPWPEYWSPNWYANDDLYVDYDYNDQGYYLYNRRDPRTRLAISVVF